MKYSYWILIGVSVLFGGCQHEGSDERASGNTAPLQQTIAPTSVRLHRAILAPLTWRLEGQGTVSASRVQQLIFQRGGVLSDWKVVNGARVAEGALLGELENTREQLEVKEAHLAVNDARYRDEDERMFLNDSTFYGNKWTEVDEKTALKSGLPQAKLRVERTLLELNVTRLHAAFEGVVSDLKVNEGQMVNAGQLLGSLYDPDRLEVKAELLEYDFPKVAVGQSAEVRLLAQPEYVLAARVASVNPAVAPTGYFEVAVRMEKTGMAVPGMKAQVTILAASKEPKLLVPLQAVVKRSERMVVFTHEEGLAKWKYVTLGQQNGEWVEVLEGLEPGSEVIVSNVFQLAHDSRVAVESFTDQISTQNR